LRDPRLAAVWEVVDFIVTSDPVLNARFHGEA